MTFRKSSGQRNVKDNDESIEKMDEAEKHKLIQVEAIKKKYWS